MTHLEFLSIDEALLLFNGENGNASSIAVYSFRLRRVVCRCLFPFRYLPREARFLTRPDSRIKDNCPSSLAKSFVTDPEVNIFAISFTLNHQIRNVCCVISARRFRLMLNSLLEKHPTRVIFQWEEWGPTVSRWLPHEGVEPTGTRNIFGCRMLARGTPSVLELRSFESDSLILLDFNPRPIRRGATTKLDGESHAIVINTESCWADPVSGAVIKSSLPYRAFTTPWPPPTSHFRFDGSNIIGRGVCSFSNAAFIW
jgi:hypothetical protein